MKIITTLKLTLILLVLATPAMAYIDPGSGSMLLQVLLAGLLSSLFAVKVFWQKIAAIFQRVIGKKNQPPIDED